MRIYHVFCYHGDILGSDAVAANSITNTENLIACLCLGLASGGGSLSEMSWKGNLSGAKGLRRQALPAFHPQWALCQVFCLG